MNQKKISQQSFEWGTLDFESEFRVDPVGTIAKLYLLFGDNDAITLRCALIEALSSNEPQRTPLNVDSYQNEINKIQSGLGTYYVDHPECFTEDFVHNIHVLTTYSEFLWEMYNYFNYEEKPKQNSFTKQTANQWYNIDWIGPQEQE